MSDVDIVLPTYNRVRLLNRAIRSVVRQTYPHWTLWVIDDGSTDTTQKTLIKCWGAKGAKPLSGKHLSLDASSAREKGAGSLVNTALSPLGMRGSSDVTFYKKRGVDSRFRGNDELHEDNLNGNEGAGPLAEEAKPRARGEVFVIKTPHQGVSAARNVGILSGKARWLAFLDSDDEWKPDKLLKQMEYAYQNPSCPLIHTNEIWIRSGKILNQKKKHTKKGGRIFKDSLSLCLMSPSSVLIQRRVFEEVGLFRPDFLVCEDYEMWLRISSRYEVGFLKEPLVIKYGGHSDQLSRQYRAMDWWRVQAMCPYLNSPLLNQEEQKELTRVLRKKCEILLKGYKKYGHNHNQKKEIEKIHRQIFK